MSVTDGPIWLSPAEAAIRNGMHVCTVQKAAASAELHSHQRSRNGCRRIAQAANDVWIRGGSEAEQIVACGCQRLAVVRRSA